MNAQLVESIALGLAVLLGWSAVSKARDVPRFTNILVETYGVIPGRARLVAVLIIGVESGTSLLLVPWARPTGLAVASILFTIFAIAAARTIALGRTGPCGCAGGSTKTLGPRTVARAAALAIVAAVLAFIDMAPGAVLVPNVPPDLLSRRVARHRYRGGGR